MTDDIITLDFTEWNKKITPEVQQTHVFFTSDEKETSQNWENLLAVANSEFLICKASEILENHRTKKPHIANQQYVTTFKIAYINWNFHCIAKTYNILWVHIFEDVNNMAEVFHNQLDYSIRFEQQMLTILILYFRSHEFTVKNKHLHTILFKLAHSMSADDRQEVYEIIKLLLKSKSS
jgi:hypothetical protein